MIKAAISALGEDQIRLMKHVTWAQKEELSSWREKKGKKLESGRYLTFSAHFFLGAVFCEWEGVGLGLA